ncbi:TonB-dependent receptor [Roseococcus sp. SDR]|uniref:TonB-dependent siderophore receptor n=1 Tax=Roseococcus sp. SDR TaxID=2835532 RepID=UPI001BCD1C09|nr:TonB-dependent receptor [Roseococcus sp. SDR]MBS7792331.1 TonB-dependent receptor [Roseococcus sp. SDR]MBV1847645.1 TonB-dependent receptor [Roseococcus sp. SDR]
MSKTLRRRERHKLSLSVAAALLSAGAASAQTEPAPARPVESTVPPTTVIGREERDQVGPLRGYQALTSGTATRTNTPLQDIPQSVTVIPRSLFTDQGATTLEEALRNSAAVVPESPLFLNQTLNTYIRGFQAEIFRDGLQSYSELGLAQSLLGIERIEIVKGPSGALFGGGLGGGFGGLVNIISQRPLPNNSYAAGITVGPYGYRNPWVDVNQAYRDPNTGTVFAMRLQAETQYGRSYIENVTTEGYNVLPTFSVTSDTTNLVVQAFFSQRKANDYPGLPPGVSGGSPRIPFDRFVNANGGNVPRTETQRNGVRMSFDHRINDVFTASLIGQFSTNSLSQPAQFQFGPPLAAFGLPVGPYTYSRLTAYLDQNLSQLSVMPMVRANFSTGPAQHTVLAGFEFDQTRDNGLMNIGDAGIFNFASPTQAPWVQPSAGSPFAIPQTNNTYTTTAGFLQDQIKLWDRLHILGAVRLTNINIQTEVPSAGINTTASTTKPTGRVGVGYDILPGLTPFVGWGNSIRSPSGYGFGGFLTAPKPEEGQQFEAGVKLNLPFGLSGNLAYFNIQRNNVPYFDLAAGGNRQIGEQRSRGFDMDLLWQPNPQFSLLGTYAYTMAETVSDSIIAPGTPLRLVPRNAGRVWANYRLRGLPLPDWAQGFSFGGGLTSVAGANTSDQPNAIRTAGYTIFDAAINYENGPLRMSVAARNIGNRNYVIPFSYFNNAMAPGAPAAVYVSAALRF